MLHSTNWKAKMNTWDVYLNGERIDTVWFADVMDASEVKASLVDHDGYNPAIRVKLA